MTMLKAMMRRDLRQQVSYRLQFVAQLGALGLTLLSYRFLSHLVPGNQSALQPFGNDYFTFVMIGTGAATFFVVSVSSFADTMQREQDTGTLEALLVTPHRSSAILLAGVAFPFLFSLVQMTLYVTAGVAAGAHIPTAGLPVAFAILILSELAFSALGMVAAATMIHTKRAAVVVGVADILFTVVGGVLYPLQLLPQWAQVISHALPISYGLDALRRSLSPQPSWSVVAADCAILAGFTIVLVPLALRLFEWSVERARRRGSLAQY
jgi:ABC-2 type transport system permease protein